VSDFNSICVDFVLLEVAIISENSQLASGYALSVKSYFFIFTSEN